MENHASIDPRMFRPVGPVQTAGTLKINPHGIVFLIPCGLFQLFQPHTRPARVRISSVSSSGLTRSGSLIQSWRTL